jgi:tripartite-type tricarboxylate transporter receptor subunit TctC
LWKAKPDGLTIGSFNAGLIYNQLLDRQTLQFDLKEFVWIGKAAGEPRAVVISEQCPIKSMQDLIASQVPVKFAAAGIGSAAYTDTKLLAEALGLNIEVIAGFDGTEGEMSMMRGEVCGQLGTTSSLQPFVKAGYGRFILAIGGNINGVPNVWEFVKDDHAKSVISLIEALAKLGRITAAPPGLPRDRYDQLLAAYQTSLQDPDLLAEAEKLGLPIEAGYGDEVKQLVVNALNQSPQTVQMLAEIIQIEQE